MTEHSKSIPQLAFVGPANEVQASLLQAAHHHAQLVLCCSHTAHASLAARFPTFSHRKFLVSGPACHQQLVGIHARVACRCLHLWTVLEFRSRFHTIKLLVLPRSCPSVCTAQNPKTAGACKVGNRYTAWPVPIPFSHPARPHAHLLNVITRCRRAPGRTPRHCAASPHDTKACTPSRPFTAVHFPTHPLFPVGARQAGHRGAAQPVRSAGCSVCRRSAAPRQARRVRRAVGRGAGGGGAAPGAPPGCRAGR